MPTPKKVTESRRTSRRVAGVAVRSRSRTRMEVTDTRRAQVYRADVEFTGNAGDPQVKKISVELMPRVHELRAGGLSWLKVAQQILEETGRSHSHTGLQAAHDRWLRNGERG